MRLRYEYSRMGGLGGSLRRLRFLLAEQGWHGILFRLRNLLKPVASPQQARPRPVAQDGAGEDLVLVVGHPHSVLGVGENLRSTCTALEAENLGFRVKDVLGSPKLHEDDLSGFAHHQSLVDGLAGHRTNLFVINANEMELALTYLGPRALDSAYNIGLWMWELAEFPRAWHRYFRYVDEIWAQSRFVEQAIARVAPVPVEWMPQVVEPGPADGDLARQFLAGEDSFTFLFFFDFNSYIERKNPLAVIAAFEAAFGRDRDEPVSLIVKMIGQAHKPAEYQRMKARCQGRDPRIRFIEEVLGAQEMRALISACDVFVSLHRSEGFGRGVAEAMYYGRPTITTAYSGVMDFACAHTACLVDYRLIPVRRGEYPYWKGQVWAEPDVEHAAAWMRRLYDDAAFCAEVGERAARSIRASHGAAAVGRRMRRRLEAAGLLR